VYDKVGQGTKMYDKKVLSKSVGLSI